MAHHFTKEENQAWFKRLPQKSLAVKVIIVSERGNILLVKPNYKPSWQFPGGGVEPFEDPKDAARRELAEELCFSIHPDNLTIVGTAFNKKYDNLMLIYKYIPRVPEDIELQIQEDEIEGFRFEAPEKVIPHLADYYQDFWHKYIGGQQKIDSK